MKLKALDVDHVQTPTLQAMQDENEKFYKQMSVYKTSMEDYRNSKCQSSITERVGA